MIYFWLDANAIAKRYVVEKGTPLINYFFTYVSAERIICLFDSMDETRFAIVKKKNSLEITSSDFNQAIQQFETEIVNSTNVVQVHATVDQKEAARQLIHNYLTVPARTSFNVHLTKQTNCEQLDMISFWSVLINVF